MPAPDAAALMRSRYSAYALGKAEYIVATTHPESPHHESDRAVWIQSIRHFCRHTTFVALQVHAHEPDGDGATVHFVARLRQGGQDVEMEEVSRFFRVAGRWLYHSAG